MNTDRGEERDEDGEARADLLSRASHELRTPLNAILGFAQLLEMDELTAEQDRRVHQIMKAGRRLVALIDDVLEVSRFEAGRLPISLEPVDAMGAMRATLDLIAPLARERSVDVADPVDEIPGVRVLADEQRLRYILLKLMSSAVTRAGIGGRVEVTLSAGPGDGRVCLSVSALPTPDVAPPPPLDMELGLSLASRLADAMHGSLGLDPQADRSSRLWVDLAQAEGVPNGARPGPRDPNGETKATVLYIEDNVVNVELVSELLAARGPIAVVNAMDGELGLELARQHQPDLICLDLNLPDMDGEEVLRRLKADPTTAGLPVIVLSSAAMPTNVDRVIAAGAIAYLTKPLDFDSFLELVDRTLA